MAYEDLIYDWNAVGRKSAAPIAVEINDETLRDGLQSPSVTAPSLEDEIKLLHLMVDMGIHAVNIGLPGAGPHVVESVVSLASEIAKNKLPISPNCAGRTLEADIVPIVEASQRAGIAIEAALFIGSSPIRSYVEGWSVDYLVSKAEAAVSFAVKHDLPVMFVTEDTTRSHPDAIRRIYTAAIEAGAGRICVTDTVGHAEPDGVRALVGLMKETVAATGARVAIDWHGHSDRGLSLINALTAIECGVDRVHATGLGVGERCGNTAMELLLVNLKLLGYIGNDLIQLPEYCDLVSRALSVPVSFDHPVIGRDAFRTGTGVHAAAVAKAIRRGDHELADRVYSSVPANWVGRKQEVDIGPMSGASNVHYWLATHGIAATDELVSHILRAAKENKKQLTESEIQGLIQTVGQ